MSKTFMVSWLNLLDSIGTMAFAASGALAGVKKQMDLFGVIVLGLVTAIGGGIVRDVILNSLPPYVFVHNLDIIIAILTSIIVFIAPKSIEKRRIFFYFDALGLGVFSAIGVSKAIDYHMSFIGSIILGTITAVFGGMIRDVLQAEIPLVLRKEIYASACIIGTSLFYVLHLLKLNVSINLFLCTIIIFTLRIIAFSKNWQLPRKML
ncbi:MAG: trimeric intracellular cation channel family protein [Desulfurella sp.]|uniref:trimeric intracellular cation channel family protein n=1 Tax=Desulfurella sp. TaxID=1962857 RepID=UPI003D0D4D2D